MTLLTYKPALYFLCYDDNRPDVGQRAAYQHVDVLNRAGIDAHVVHRRPTFRPTWFHNTTTIVSREEFRRRYRSGYDIVVLPSDQGTRINNFTGLKVILTKSLYSGFHALPLRCDYSDPYLADSVIGIVATSYYDWEHLRTAYPQKEIAVVHSVPDEAVCFPAWTKKKCQIVSTGSAQSQDAVLFHLLRARACQGLNHGNRFKWIFAHEMLPDDFTRALAESLVYVHLSAEDGLSGSILRAIGAGCISVTYNTPPFSEFSQADDPFQYGQLTSVIRYMERLMKAYPDHWHEFEETAERQRLALEVFSAEKQTDGILCAWQRFIDRAQRVRCTPGLLMAQSGVRV